MIKTCEYCNNDFKSKRSITRFCCVSCSTSFNNLKRSRCKGDRKKTSITVRIRNETLYKLSPNYCLRCNAILEYKFRNRKTCIICIRPTSLIQKLSSKPRLCASITCNNEVEKRKHYCGKCKTNIRHYRSLCSFKFSVYDFPEEFDLKLIRVFGWYSPPGKRNKSSITNINGVSRDHIYNISDGYRENRDPNCLAHPANCKIMKHNGPKGNNAKKKSDISWEELLKKIKDWDNKYLN